MDEAPILVAQRAGYRIVTLNRPQRLNAFTEAMHDALNGALDEAVADENCRALLLTGAGRGFCAGQDLNDRVPQPGQKRDTGAGLDKFYNPLVRRLHALPFPTVAAINGVAAGAGCNVALHCDIVLAARSARFIQAFAKIGLVPDAGGTWLLPRLVGMARARGLALLAEPLSAEQAEQWGLIWKVVDDDALMGEAEKLCAHFAQRADHGAHACPARARCLRNQHARRPARSRARFAARSGAIARLWRRRARLPGKARARVQRAQGLMLHSANQFVIPGRRHKRVYARLRRAMAPDPESRATRTASPCRSGFRARSLRSRPGMTTEDQSAEFGMSGGGFQRI